MKQMQNKKGQVGMIVILVVLVIVGVMVIRNFSTSSNSSDPNRPSAGPDTLTHFQNEAKKIEEMQNRRLQDPNPSQQPADENQKTSP